MIVSESKPLNGSRKTVDEPAEAEQEADDAHSTYSFHSEYSYELCIDSPDPAKLRQRPTQVPPLDLGVIPGY